MIRLLVRMLLGFMLNYKQKNSMLSSNFMLIWALPDTLPAGFDLGLALGCTSK